MAAEKPSLTGRDAKAYRSAMGPVQQVIDGTLCGRFTEMYQRAVTTGVGMERVVGIAEGVAAEPKGVVRKLDELRQRYL
jgi:hypothetical protein